MAGEIIRYELEDNVAVLHFDDDKAIDDFVGF